MTTKLYKLTEAAPRFYRVDNTRIYLCGSGLNRAFSICSSKKLTIEIRDTKPRSADQYVFLELMRDFYGYEYIAKSPYCDNKEEEAYFCRETDKMLMQDFSGAKNLWARVFIGHHDK